LLKGLTVGAPQLGSHTHVLAPGVLGQVPVGKEHGADGHTGSGQVLGTRVADTKKDGNSWVPGGLFGALALREHALFQTHVVLAAAFGLGALQHDLAGGRGRNLVIEQNEVGAWLGRRVDHRPADRPARSWDGLRAEHYAEGMAPARSGLGVTMDLSAFWTFWTEHEAALFDGVQTGLDDALIALVSAQVHALHEDLGWEFGQGEGGLSFALKTGGDPQQRRVARAWLACAPAYERWQFFDAIPPAPIEKVQNFALRFGEQDISFSELRFALDPEDDRQRVHVRGFHPVLVGAETQHQLSVLYTVLDTSLGEAAVELWLGQIEVVEAPLDEGLDLAALRRAIDAQGETWREAGEAWASARGTNQETDMPVLFTLNMSAKRWDYPLLDTYFELVISYPARPDGLPSPSDYETLMDLDEKVGAALPELVLHLGSRMGEGERVLFGYVDGQDTDGLRAAAVECLGSDMGLRLEKDARWEKRVTA
jgi:hypothetical protein